MQASVMRSLRVVVVVALAGCQGIYGYHPPTPGDGDGDGADADGDGDGDGDGSHGDHDTHPNDACAQSRIDGEVAIIRYPYTITVDGELDDAAWSDPLVDWQYVPYTAHSTDDTTPLPPTSNADASFEFAIVASGTTLYVGLRTYDDVLAVDTTPDDPHVGDSFQIGFDSDMARDGNPALSAGVSFCTCGAICSAQCGACNVDTCSSACRSCVAANVDLDDPGNDACECNADWALPGYDDNDGFIGYGAKGAILAYDQLNYGLDAGFSAQLESAVTTTSDGWVMEVAIPLSWVGTPLPHSEGSTIGVAVVLNDDDTLTGGQNTRDAQIAWQKVGRTDSTFWKDARAFGAAKFCGPPD